MTAQANSFQWSRFLMYLGSFCILILLAGLLVGMAVGLRPLEARAARVVSHTPTTIEILWPTIGRADEGKPKAGANTGAAGAPVGQPQTWLPKQQQEELLAAAQQ